MRYIYIKYLCISSVDLIISRIPVLGLECYVCENQEDNNEKCVKTIKTCEHNQDVCLTEIRWGSTPYWSQGAKKQYYVSKRCSNKTECALTRQHYMPLCTHIWYQDWVCSDCCQGDRCNYYVIVSNFKILWTKLMNLSLYLETNKHVRAVVTSKVSVGSSRYIESASVEGLILKWFAFKQ